MSLVYPREKLYGAMLALATGQGSIHKRLEAACVYELSVLQPNDYPLIQNDLESLQREMTSKGSIPETVAAMSTEEAQILARQIVDLYGAVAKALGSLSG